MLHARGTAPLIAVQTHTQPRQFGPLRVVHAVCTRDYVRYVFPLTPEAPNICSPRYLAQSVRQPFSPMRGKLYWSFRQRYFVECVP